MQYFYQQRGIGGNIDPWINLDGRLNAPFGSPQYPNQLNGYPSGSPPGARIRWPDLTGVQPQWKCAGIDYAVGIDRSSYPTNANLKDPAPGGVLAAALTAQGGSLSSGLITFSGSSANNAIVDGWDFSLHNNSVFINSCNNFTIQNSNWKITSSLTCIKLAAAATNITIQKNIIDANTFSNGTEGTIETNSPSLTIQYNWIKNGASEDIRIGCTSASFTTTVQYNIIENSGLGAPALHGDWVQILSAPGDNLTNCTFNFNLFQQSLPDSVAATQGISFNGNVNGNFISENVLNNVMLANPTDGGASGKNVNTFVNSDKSWLNGTLTVNSNYFDTTGLTPPLSNWLTFVSGSGPFVGLLVKSGNINMLDGSSLT